MAIPGINFTEEEGKILKDLARSLRESTDSAKQTYESFQKTLHGIDDRLAVDAKQRLADFKLFTKAGQDRLRKENERTDALLKELKDSHRLMANIQQDSKAMRQVILSIDTHRYLKRAGGELARTYGEERRQLVDRNVGASFLDYFMKKLPLSQILTGRYVGVPGSHERIFEDQRKKLLGVAERDAEDIKRGALLEGNLGVGQGDKYTGTLREIEEGATRRTREIINWKKRAQRDPVTGRFLPGNIIGRHEGEGSYTGESVVGSEEREIAKEGKKKTPLHPTAAFVSNLPANYAAGSLLIYDLIKEQKDEKKTERGGKDKGGGLLSKLPWEVSAGLVLSPIALANAIGGAIAGLLGGALTLAISALPLAIATTVAAKIFNIPQLDLTKQVPKLLSKVPFLSRFFPQTQETPAVPPGAPPLGTTGNTLWNENKAKRETKAGGGIIGSTGLANMHKGEIVLSPNESAQFSNNLQKLVADSAKSKEETISTQTLEMLIDKLRSELVAEMKKNNELTQKGVELAAKEPDNRKPIENPSRAYVSTP